MSFKINEYIFPVKYVHSFAKFNNSIKGQSQGPRTVGLSFYKKTDCNYVKYLYLLVETYSN